MELESTLPTYFQYVKYDVIFLNLDEISGLGKRMFETRKILIHHLVYFLVKLSMLLLVVTARVKRVFYAMSTVKTIYQHRICDE